MGLEKYMATDCKSSHGKFKGLELEFESCKEPLEVSMQEGRLFYFVGSINSVEHNKDAK